MITFPLTPPREFLPQAITIRSRNIVGVTQAPFSGLQQIQEHAGAWWECELTFPPLPEAVGKPIVGFIESLRGPRGTFVFNPSPMVRKPYGMAADSPGNPVVYGQPQTGLTLNIAASLGSVQGYLLAGDLLSIGSEAAPHLHRVTRDADLISGRGVINIWPRLREVPNDGDEIRLFAPTGLFRLSIPAPQWDVDENGFYYVDPLPIIEALGNI